MNDNVYAPPKAELGPDSRSMAGVPFYVVSPRKFLILFIATLSIYQVYWLYKNWALYRQASGESLWPVPRAIFSVFFLHSLFRHVKAHKQEDAPGEWNNNASAWAMVGLIVVSNTLSRLSSRAVGSPYTDWLSLLTLIPLALCFLPVQNQINARCGDPAGSSNDKLTGANLAWCVVGAIIWILALIGLFATDAVSNAGGSGF
ncbi:hypothetical protein ASC94_15715 [Massilia sp. Root418]|uniref:hypothetical protein n=1 Tax=Massilia sp. Root418 TaxID=1736532 RepID=UPI0006FA9284|nr:hypothetical protein [Massilia sp. Root418]KQW93989.1 hypothetical protein ASC94_15715 [Massilia sp. Root418]